MKSMKRRVRRIKRVSLCYRCIYRYPIHNNPEKCVLGLMSKHDMEHCMGHSYCSRYVTDTDYIEWNKHLNSFK